MSTSIQHSSSSPRVGDRMPDRMGRCWQVRDVTMFAVSVRDVAQGAPKTNFLLTRAEFHKLCSTPTALSENADRF